MKLFLSLLSAALLLSCGNGLEEPATLFSLKGESTGIHFENKLEYTEDFNPYTYRNFYNGGGVALADVNNDGLLDVYLTGNIVANKLFLNKGDWQFEDITEKAGVACQEVWSTGATFADINGDGWLDLYVCKSGKPGGANRNNELFINNGDLTFTEKSQEFGLDITGLSVHAAFFDYDKDGDLDCYILNNSIRSVGAYDLIKDQRNIPDSNGNKLLKNENGHFVDVSSEAGIYSSAIGFGLGITLSDFNNDSWTDIFISNDFFERDYLYLNNQDGTFQEALETNFQSISMGSMGADAADLNNDLLSDLMVTEMLPATLPRQRTKASFESWDKHSLAVKQGYFHQFPRNVLQRNLGQQGFVEISRAAGVSASEWSWASLIFDMDNDGLRDILISNGIYKDLLDRDYLNYMANEEKIRNMIKDDKEVIKKLIDVMPSQAVSNAVFKNKGNFGFEDISQTWGLDQASFSNGSAYGDLDNDGDLDIVINNVNMPSFVYENNSDSVEHKSIRLSLSATRTENTKAIGAKAIIKYGNGKMAMGENYPSRGFQSSVGSGIHFGTGNHDKVDTLIIQWPNGAQSLETNLATNKLYAFEQPVNNNTNILEQPKGSSPLIPQEPLFSFGHQENKFIDFNRERMLPQMFSNEGPALATGDVNMDGYPDYYVGGAKNQSGSLFISDSKGTYKETNQPFSKDTHSEDTDALFFDSDNDGDLDLYVCSGGKAFSRFDYALTDRLYLNDGKGNFSKSGKSLPFPKMVSSSTISVADINADGLLDIFVGGRFDPQLYGPPSSGFVLQNEGNNSFLLADQPALENIGMLTDAEWIDLNKDSFPDLIIAGEWMPIRVFINEKGTLKEQTDLYGLSLSKGLWSTIEVKDLDQDGNPDIIAGNVGNNGYCKAGDRMYINDFDANGTYEQLICHKIDGEYYPIVDRDELLAQLPYLKRKLFYFKDYATATMNSIFAPHLIESATYLDLDTTESAIFLNTGSKFEIRKMPSEIQYSTVNAIKVFDIDRDGVTDIFLGGNQELVKPQYGKWDASLGWGLYGKVTEKGYQAKEVKSLGISGSIRKFEILARENDKILLSAINNDTLQFHKIQ